MLAYVTSSQRPQQQHYATTLSPSLPSAPRIQQHSTAFSLSSLAPSVPALAAATTATTATTATMSSPAADHGSVQGEERILFALAPSPVAAPIAPIAAPAAAPVAGDVAAADQADPESREELGSANYTTTTATASSSTFTFSSSSSSLAAMENMSSTDEMPARLSLEEVARLVAAGLPVPGARTVDVTLAEQVREA